jgi:hypothetical protein
VQLQNLEYGITPHKDKLVCKEYKHSGGGPVVASQQSQAWGLPAGMLGKQVPFMMITTTQLIVTCIPVVVVPG